MTNNFLAALVVAFCIAASSGADAANRFWVGGTGTWDSSTTTHWAATTGGAGGQSVPGSSDQVTFDGSSGGGTVTVNTTVNIQTLTCGAFTGTLDFSANNNNVTLTATGSTAFSCSGTGTRTLNLGNGTWTLANNLSSSQTVWTMATTTGLTFSANSSTIIIGGTFTSVATFAGGGLTYNTLTIQANSSKGGVSVTGANTFANLNVAAPNTVYFPNGSTNTVTAFSITGGSGTNPIGFLSASTSAATISSASTPTMAWMAFRDLTFTGGGTFSATNSFDLGANTGITITGPSGGSGTSFVGIIGGS